MIVKVTETSFNRLDKLIEDPKPIEVANRNFVFNQNICLFISPFYQTVSTAALNTATNSRLLRDGVFVILKVIKALINSKPTLVISGTMPRDKKGEILRFDY